MPNIPAVTLDVLAWLTNGTLRLPTTCKEALGGHVSSVDEESPTPLLDTPSPADKFKDLSQYENPTPEFRAQIERDLDSGKFPNINLVKLL